jgi:hypothetical protein
VSQSREKRPRSQISTEKGEPGLGLADDDIRHNAALRAGPPFLLAMTGVALISFGI